MFVLLYYWEFIKVDNVLNIIAKNTFVTVINPPP